MTTAKLPTARQTYPPLFIRDTTASDLSLSLENRDRYIAQSAATKAGAPAPLPARRPVSRVLTPVK